MEGEKDRHHFGASKSFKLMQHWCLCLFIFTLITTSTSQIDYGDALSKSLLYFEAQRSGRIPYNQRVTWRHHSGLTDGLEQGVSSQILTTHMLKHIKILSFDFWA